eukprot:jgi/Ulvmu1/2373/UM130_0004.1
MDGHGLRSLQPDQLQLRALIARGGFATCFRGTHEDQVVAVKVVPRLTADTHNRYCFQSFLHECKLMQDMQHENTVRCLGVVTLSPRHFAPLKSSTPRELLDGGFGLVQEYCSGGSVADLLLAVETSPFRKLFSPEQALGWCKDICAALNYIHTLDAPIIHRDLKLDNVLLSDEEGPDPATGGRGVKRTAKLADFGLGACIMKGVARVATHVRAPLGSDLDISLSYALEAAHEGSRVGHAPADVSAHMSTGSQAFASAALQALAADDLAAAADGAPPPETAAASAAEAEAAAAPGGPDSARSAAAVAAAGADSRGRLELAGDLRRVMSDGSLAGVAGGGVNPNEPMTMPLVNAGNSIDDSITLPKQLAPIQEVRSRGDNRRLGRGESVTLTAGADDAMSTVLPFPAHVGAPEGSAAACVDDSDGLPGAAYETVPPAHSMGPGTASQAMYATIPPSMSWPRRVTAADAAADASRSSKSESNSEQLLSVQSMRSSERPGQASLMASVSSVGSVQLPVPPHHLGHRGSAGVVCSDSPRGVSPRLAADPADASAAAATATATAAVPSPLRSPRLLSTGTSSMLSPRPALLDAPAAVGLVGRAAPPGAIGEGMDRDASDDERSDSGWHLRDTVTPTSELSHAPPDAMPLPPTSKTSEDGAALSSIPIHIRKAMPAVQPLGLPNSMPNASLGHRDLGRSSTYTADGRIKVGTDAEVAAAAAASPHEPAHRAGSAPDVHGKGPILKTISAPPLRRQADSDAAAAAPGGDELGPSTGGRHLSERHRRHVVNVYTLNDSKASPQPDSGAGPQTDRPVNGSPYSPLDAPLSEPVNAPRRSTAVPQATRNAATGPQRMSIRSEPQSKQRIVSVSQILPSNFLVPDGYDSIFPSLPSPTVASPSALPPSTSTANARLPSGGTHELYGANSRRSVDGGAADSDSGMSSPDRCTPALSAALSAALPEVVAPVVRATPDAEQLPPPPPMHQVFSALALKVAKVERQPGGAGEQLSDRSARSDSGVTFRGGTDILPQM